MLNSGEIITKKLTEKIKIDSFFEKILESIENYLYNENNKDLEVSINENNIIIKNKYSIVNIILGDNYVLYVEENNDKKVTNEYKEIEQGYIVKLTEQTEDIYELKNPDFNDRRTIVETRFYNKQYNEIYRGIKTNIDNYIKNEKTNEMELKSPNIFENYVEKEYYYRIEDKYILSRIIKEFVYPEETSASIRFESSDNIYLRYETINKNDKDIAIGGHYYEIDKDLFFDYFQNNVTSDDIVENFKTKEYHI